jgi:Holliday junction resolvasome RuvABC DNA-binding subunit
MMEICDKSYSQDIALLTTVPGIKSQSAMTILSELGNDLSSFKTSSNLVGRAGLRARNDEGNKYALLVKRMAPQKALVAIAGKLLVIIWNVLTCKEAYRASFYR